MHVLIFKADVV